MKKTETKRPAVGTKKPFWDGRLRASTPGYWENYNSIFKQKSIKGVPFLEIGKDFISGAQSSSNLEITIKNNLN